jgi:hypothetical protein
VGCTSKDVVTVTVGSGALSVSAIPSGTVCSGQTVALSVNGASSYTWSGNVQNNVPFTPQVSGIYTVTALDSIGCVTKKTITIQVIPSPSVSIGPSFPATCSGKPVTLIANSTGTNYLWNNGANTQTISVSPTVTTNYSVIVSSSSNSVCPASGMVQVMVYPAPALSVTASQSVICVNAPPVTVSAGGALTYTWITAGNTGTVNGGSMNVSPLVTTVYSVTGVAATGCTGSSAITISVSECVGLAEISPSRISVFPNPNDGQFCISTTGVQKMKLINSLGQLIENITLDDKQTPHLVKNLPAGVYFLIGCNGVINSFQKIVVTSD